MAKDEKIQPNRTMLTDLYQLTMMAAYRADDKDDMATFDLFIRKLPKDWNYFIANGIEEAVDYLTDIKFTEKDIEYLANQGLDHINGNLSPETIRMLKDFRFEGDVYAVKEGTPVFPNEPILRVTAKRTQAQFVETALLNIINYQTMIASKASRIITAAAKGDAKVADFGLRRAQGMDAAMKGARAAFIAGAVSTSNVMAGMEYGIPISGTHAHSFVMSYPTEIEAFRAYVWAHPKNPTLLIDTYDTIQGAWNAVKVAKEMEKGETSWMKGRLGAVRLDSGDLADLSKKVHAILDENGLDYVKVVASNDLNEYKIEDLVNQGSPIAAYGVGTEMITAKPTAAISGVYKLVEDEAGGKIKLSPGKKSLPGRKQVYRVLGADGRYCKDVIALERESMTEPNAYSLLELAVKDGARSRTKPGLAETREYSLAEVARLPGKFRGNTAVAEYNIELSDGLAQATVRFTQQHAGNFL